MTRRLDVNRRPENSDHLRDALWLLLRAYDYAKELDHDVWSFAVEMPVLSTAHLTTSDLRWLACKGYVDHACETTKPDDHERHFSRNGAAMFTPETCVVLTSVGCFSWNATFAAKQSCHRHRQNLAWPSAASPLPRMQPRPPEVGSRSTAIAFRWSGGEGIQAPLAQSRNGACGIRGRRLAGADRRSSQPGPNLDPRRRLRRHHKAMNRNQKRTLLASWGMAAARGFAGSRPPHRTATVATIRPDPDRVCTGPVWSLLAAHGSLASSLSLAESCDNRRQIGGVSCVGD